MHDMKACYWNMLSRAESPRAVMRPGGKVVWLHRDGECAKLKMLSHWVQSDKRLRNSLVGAMVGSSRERVAVSKGEFIAWHNGPGPWQELGSLIARSAYELTLLETQRAKGAYANVDCVISADDRATVFGDHGMPYTTIEGEADIQCPGGYRIGHKITKFYRENGKFRLAHNSGMVAVNDRYSKWLAST